MKNFFLRFLHFLKLIISRNKDVDHIPLTENNTIYSIGLPKKFFDSASKTLLSNNTYLYKKFQTYSYNEKNIWNKLPKTYNLYINSLNDVSYLTILFKQKRDLNYLIQAKKIIKKWLRYSQEASFKSNKYAWCDHSIAHRALSLINFLLFKEKVSDSDLYNEEFLKTTESTLKEHALWLYDDHNYSKGNHGLMVDQALLLLGMYKKNHSWINKAIERINTRILQDFTKEGVHLENSPDYHVLIMRYYRKIKDFLEYYNMSSLLNNRTIGIIKKMPKYLVHITMPNKKLPTIGDSSKSKFNDNFDNQNLTFLLSDGRRGEKPKKKFKYYKNAGVGIYRNSWNTINMKESLWWTIKSGASSPMHKHDDDLSFVLHAFGNEIFSDAGKFNYDTTDIFRKYALSPQGHNTISIKDKNYFAFKNLNKINYLNLVKKNKKMIWFSAKHFAYAETLIQRNFIFIKPNTFIIIDRTYSKKRNIYSQHFVLGPNIEIAKYNNASFFAVSNDQKSLVDLRQYLYIDDAKTYNADESSGKGYISEDFEEKTPVNYIEFLKKGNNVTYVTSIQLNNSHYKNKIKKVKLEKNTLKLLINNETFVFNLEKLKL
jgi:hypothetical protein